jgi:hypothetical protein
MKAYRVVLAVWAVVVATGGAGAPRVAAEEISVGASADVSAVSAYVWRGQVLNDEAVMQPSATITKGGFSLNTWGNLNLTDSATGDSAEFSEVDLTVSYSRSVGPATLSGGLIEYLFPNQTLVNADGTSEGYPGTREVYLAAALPALPVVPSLALYYDFEEADSFYALASLGYGAKLAETLNLGLYTSLGYGASDYNAFYFGVDDDALNDANFGVSLTWSPCDRLSLTPGYQYTLLVDSDIEDAAAELYRDKDQSIFSLKASYVF